jgi:hypothetical protein
MEVNAMLTMRNLGGVALFLFGTTYLWLTPMFAGRWISTRGILWSITQVLAFITLLGFTIATWGLFKKSSWWDGVAICIRSSRAGCTHSVLDCSARQR